MNLSFIIPTRNRAAELDHTLEQLSVVPMESYVGGAELIVIDNDSDVRLEIPAKLRNGMNVHRVILDENLNTAARNIGSEIASGKWLLMLDDDSSPLPGSSWTMLDQVSSEVGAVGGEILLPDGSHESGGLPEVIVGCGCAIRRELFIELGGYDRSFGYYAEEYDLCARVIASGSRVIHSRSFRFEHRKTQHGRNFSDIICRLTRNNAWMMARYAPVAIRQSQIQSVTDRYRAIAEREGVLAGFERAMHELESTIESQKHQPLNETQWDRFTGRSSVRQSLGSAEIDQSCAVQIMGESHAKGRVEIEQELARFGCKIVDDAGDVQVIGTLSPGVSLDLQNEFPKAISAYDWDSDG